MTSKLCSFCLVELPLSSFYKSPSNKSGYKTSCKSCYNDRQKLRDPDSKRKSAAKWREENKNGRADYQRAYRKSNPERTLELDRKHKNLNRVKLNQRAREYKRENRGKVRAGWANWYARNRDYACHLSALRRAKLIEATPPWLSDEQLSEIKRLYWMTKDLKSISGQDYHVDHIVPLRGKTVCGLHVPWNLQILPADLNLSKGASTCTTTFQ